MGYSSVYVKFYRPKLTHRRDEKDPTAHRYDFITLFSFCKVRIGSFFVLFLPDLPRFPPPVGRHRGPPVRGRPTPLAPHAPVRAEMHGCCPASVRSLRRVLFVAPYTIARAVTSPRRAGPSLHAHKPLLRTLQGIPPRRGRTIRFCHFSPPRPHILSWGLPSKYRKRGCRYEDRRRTFPPFPASAPAASVWDRAGLI